MGVVGENGTGKTTLLRVLVVGELTADADTVERAATGLLPAARGDTTRVPRQAAAPEKSPRAQGLDDGSSSLRREVTGWATGPPGSRSRSWSRRPGPLPAS
ncbi:hypothetical protein [Streptomyces adelaidensis]|uniref:hypothetical protein n=1 Tax=Streptomyces adelaidensis TaxID=2796465 RepID=UPI003555C612